MTDRSVTILIAEGRDAAPTEVRITPEHEAHIVVAVDCDRPMLVGALALEARVDLFRWTDDEWHRLPQYAEHEPELRTEYPTYVRRCDDQRSPGRDVRKQALGHLVEIGQQWAAEHSDELAEVGDEWREAQAKVRDDECLRLAERIALLTRESNALRRGGTIIRRIEDETPTTHVVTVTGKVLPPCPLVA